MNFKRLVMFAVASAVMIAAAPVFAQDSGGGAAALPQAEVAQDQTPTTPEGEEQPPAEEPDGGEQPPSEEPTTTPPPEEGNVGDESTGGALPETGWQVFALLSIGLGLLLAGAALWPTSSWPPPRDRLSRSTSRR